MKYEVLVLRRTEKENRVRQRVNFTHNEVDYDVELWPKKDVRFRMRPARKFQGKIASAEMLRAVRAFQNRNESRIEACRPGNA